MEYGVFLIAVHPNKISLWYWIAHGGLIVKQTISCSPKIVKTYAFIASIIHVYRFRGFWNTQNLIC